MLVSEFNFDLPDDRIAQQPPRERGASRLLYLSRDTGVLRDDKFQDLPDLLRSGDLLVRNNTRVLCARLFGRRAGRASGEEGPPGSVSGMPSGIVEVLLTRQDSAEPTEWECLVRPGRKIGIGEQLFFGEGTNELRAEVIDRGGFGERRIRFAPVPDFFPRLERIGHMPLPPYIDREDSIEDRERYQTVYAKDAGSAAAPTAGLHFTSEIFERLAQRGVEVAEVTLHVGLGTFQPVRVERVEDHHIHVEPYSISAETASRINAALDAGRRIVAVGTTTVRTLEHSARHNGGRVAPGSANADVFICPGFDFRVTGAIITNFHLPQSTLLMLVCAFAGKDRVLAAYHHAVEQRYRFYSYGDCMFIE